MEGRESGRGRGQGGQRGGRGNRNQSAYPRGGQADGGENPRGGRGRGRGNYRNAGNQSRDPSEEFQASHGDGGADRAFPSRVVLNVAEKPSIARAITDALRKGATKSEFSRSKYNPIFKFVRMFGNQEVTMKVTSVTGHIREIYFDESYKDWNRVDPVDLIETAPVKARFSEDKMGIVENIKTLARQCTDLVLWLDCDREGEAIAYEVIDVCASVGVTERTIQVHRAKFSSTAVGEIRRAFENLGKPQKSLSDAVEVRQEIDLRIGAAFTRLQTISLRGKIPESAYRQVISYGPCQMPTLGFVVQRYIQIRDFVKEDFWAIKLTAIKEGKKVEFNWDRDRVYDQNVGEAMLELCKAGINPSQPGRQLKATVERVKKERRTKRKPLPLTTVNLQKIGTRKLRMSGKEIMDIAEKLYTQGFISYPRTETDQFPYSIDLKQILRNLVEFPDPQTSDFVNNQVNGNGFEAPRRGQNNDQAHPPIHPIKLPHGLQSRQRDVYNLVAKHFIACCSKDAVGEATEVQVQLASEGFHLTGITILERNYLEVYPYDYWEGNQIPKFERGETLQQYDVCLRQSSTTPPSLLSEADLIGLMEKNQIGTDATIHEHIQTIQERQYAVKQGGLFKPLNLGVSLIEGYQGLGLEVCEPKIRAKMEKDMVAIAQGTRRKEDVLAQYKREMAEIFRKLVAAKTAFINEIVKNVNKNSNLNGETADDDPNGPGPDDDEDGGNPGPRGGNARGISEPFSNPRNRPGHSDHSMQGPRFPQHQNNFHQSSGNQHQGFQKDRSSNKVVTCPKCSVGNIIIKSRKDGTGMFLSCSQYPDCRASNSLPSGTTFAKVSDQQCASCSAELQSEMFKVDIKLGNNPNTMTECLFCSNKFPGYVFNPLNPPNSSTGGQQQTHQQSYSNQTAVRNPPVQRVDNGRPVPTCYSCQQPGHYVSECPNRGRSRPRTPPRSSLDEELDVLERQQMSASRGPAPYANRSAAAARPQGSNECFLCKQTGHWARECPQGRPR